MLHAVVLVTLAGLVAAVFDPELHAKYLTMPRSTFIEYFNAQNYSWKMAEYDNIQEKFIACAQINKEAIENLPIKTHDLEAIHLPDNFDAREQWPQCETIKEIYDQGKCGSCWTFGSGMTASDRTCIHKDVHIRLSQQDFECLQTNVCGGGDPLQAFDFWVNEGLVTQECKPYDIEELHKNNCTTKCVNTDISYKEDKHFGDWVYTLSSNSDEIKAELVKNGPIQAGFGVFSDFLEYESGIYEYTHGEFLGLHSVRIVGYGVENGINYWLAANSWGGEWGEHGLFRVKINDAYIGFEEFLATGMPKN